MLQKKDTVIFDLDGTLLNTLEDLKDGVNVIMERFGWPSHSLEKIRTYVGNGLEKLMERAIPEGYENPQFKQAFEEFKTYYTEHCQIKTKPYDGVVELMQVLAAHGISMAIVSNKNDSAVKELNEIYFSKYVQVAIGEKSGQRRKPAPDAVYAALRELGKEKESAVYIGDSEVDYETATNSELDVILVTWGFRDRDVLEKFENTTIVESCSEIQKILCGGAEPSQK